MSDDADPLDEVPYDPLDESPEPDDRLVQGGADGFLGTLQEARERSARLASPGLRPLRPEVAFSVRRRRAFLRALSQTGNLTLSCAAAGWSKDHMRTVRARDEEFDRLCHEALDTAADHVEAELFRRAVHGVEEPVWHKPKDGEPTVVGYVTKYSDQLMQTLVKGLRPEKYRERHEVQHEGSKGGVLVVPAMVPLDEWEAAAARQQAQYREAPKED